MLKPYYQDDFVTLYHGDCEEVVPRLGQFDLVLIDPPYGIGQDKGVRLGGRTPALQPRRYEDSWDKERVCRKLLGLVLDAGCLQIVWGGNYYSDLLPLAGRWLVWDKEQPMPSFSDAELAWTNLRGNATYMFRYSGGGMLAKERTRYHPTQKPEALMSWCIQQADTASREPVKTILDAFAGSGTTGVAAKSFGRKCVLVEREERYCEIAAQRLRQEYLPLSGI